MNYLLDTHAFLWWDTLDPQLSSIALQVLQNSANTIYVSMASLWEMQIKLQLGKLIFSVSLQEKIKLQMDNNGLRLLPIIPDHVYALQALPNLHRDPFDRMLIAQAVHENMTLISSDSQIAQYPIPILW